MMEFKSVVIFIYSEATHEFNIKSNNSKFHNFKSDNVLYMEKFENLISIHEYTKKIKPLLFLRLNFLSYDERVEITDV